MSAARVGEWHLLDYDEDPVPAEASGLDAVIRHYKEIAESMTTQAALLKRIGDGDETLLKGEAADAMRKRAQESHEALGKAAARYENVHAALTTYQPQLKTARSETGKALAKAEDAAAALKGAEGMSDPANADRPDDAPPLTDTEKQASQKRTDAIGTAKGDLESARSIARAAMAALDAAAEAAARTIRKNWNEDGLKHSGWEAFVSGFNKFLKGLVEILGWIGMALAVLAMIIPGLGALAMAALVVGVVALVGTIALAAQGEESWLAVVWSVVGVFAAVGGMVAAKAIAASVKASSGLGRTAIAVQMDDLGRLAERMAVFRNNIDGPFSAFALSRVFSGGLKISESVKNIFKLQSLLKINPNAWKTWSFTGMIGLGGLKELGGINAAIKSLSVFGITGAGVKPWAYVLGSGSWFIGLTSGAWSTGVPGSSFGDDDLRHSWEGRSDWEYNHMTTGAGEPI
ncbi:hypothetical protein L1785_08650 [Antribacter sp. KLBMP9083]|uniref:Uncharacterized protein n=1 Tax=Antribacter soli TaxID=2910976 RepID=A0AA41U776_9MICO|nr:hypothetical protein [Antribacter soli]MCF4121050.1 hypothetical protein [Antribacter soli]